MIDQNPLQPIFSRNEDHNKIAFMNWRVSRDASDIEKLRNMADGFMTSAIDLAKRSWLYNQNKEADILIFPMLHNANHGIELYLKAIMWALNQLMNSEKRIEGNHNIDQMFRMIKSKIKKHYGQEELKDFEEVTRELEHYIKELTAKIRATPKEDKMDFSRYPFNTKYENHFYVDVLGTVEIDVENFFRRFESIHRMLDQLFYWLEEQIDDKESD